VKVGDLVTAHYETPRIYLIFADYRRDATWGEPMFKLLDLETGATRIVRRSDIKLISEATQAEGM